MSLGLEEPYREREVLYLGQVFLVTLGVQIRVVRGINIAWGNLDMLIRVSGLFQGSRVNKAMSA